MQISCSLLQEQCCGAYNYSDYERAGWSQTININAATIDTKIPVSCCKKSSTAGETPTSVTDFENLAGCLNGQSQYINDKVFDVAVFTFAYHKQHCAV